MPRNPIMSKQYAVDSKQWEICKQIYCLLFTGLTPVIL